MSEELPSPLDLNRIERRVLGVLIEKGLTTPEYYPMTLNSIVAACNQKSNRDPLSNYSEDDVIAALEALTDQKLAIDVTPISGRSARYRQELGQRAVLSGPELGVVGELLLRGEQSEGELRSRASRMRRIADLSTLRQILQRLATMKPVMVFRLSPPGAQRGVRWTHALMPEAERPSAMVAMDPAITNPERAGNVTEPLEASASPELSTVHSVEQSALNRFAEQIADQLAGRIAMLESRVEVLEQQIRKG